MNSPSPLIPQGTINKQQDQKQSNFRLAVYSILAVHLVLLGGLLMQGCKPRKTDVATSDTNMGDAFPPLTTNDYFPAPTNYISSVIPAATSAPSTANSPPEPAPVVVGASPRTKDYVVARGDTFSKIAKVHGTTVKALADANPDVSPTKLRIGQRIQVPTSTGASQDPGSGRVSNGGATTASGFYVVKSGDTLAKIARNHGVTLRALRAANNLKVDQIKVGQKLKLPAVKGNGGGGTGTLAPSGVNY